MNGVLEVNPGKANEDDYVKLIIALFNVAPCAETCTEVSECLPQKDGSMAHDSVDGTLK